MAGHHLATPMPIAECRRLAAFAGECNGEEMVDDDSYTMKAYTTKIQFSPDAEGWADVLTGVYRRIN
jgi:hypothetical protein